MGLITKDVYIGLQSKQSWSKEGLSSTDQKYKHFEWKGNRKKLRLYFLKMIQQDPYKIVYINPFGDGGKLWLKYLIRFPDYFRIMLERQNKMLWKLQEIYI